MDRNFDRARGALWGQAIGDALGTTQEFTSPSDRRPFPELNGEPQRDIVGGGPFGLDEGQVTDDTQMAVCLAESLAERGAFDAEDLGKRYAAWSEVAFDIGNLTRASLGQVKAGVRARDAGFLAWEKSNRDQAGNGSLMRCSPLPVFFAHDPDALRRASLDDSAITHADPRCRLAVAAFVAAIRHALVAPAASADSMRRAALEELPVAAGALEPATPAKLVAQARDSLTQDLELATHDDPELMTAGSGAHLYRQAGYVRVAFRLAFWELLHAPTFEAVVLDAANRGGDADTNAAIAGALAGALHGERAIRDDWRRKVETACAGPRHRATPWGDRYHPRRLFRVLGG